MGLNAQHQIVGLVLVRGNEHGGHAGPVEVLVHVFVQFLGIFND